MYNQSMNQSSFHRTLLIVLDFKQLEQTFGTTGTNFSLFGHDSTWSYEENICLTKQSKTDSNAAT